MVINPVRSSLISRRADFWLLGGASIVLWVVMAILALVRLQFLWLPLVSEYLPYHLSPILGERPMQKQY